MAHTIAVLSQKGGTGKTTAVRTLTDVFRRSGLRTLAIDLDPQGNLSDYFDLSPDVEPTIADVLSGRSSAAEAIHEDMIPANLTLAEAELMLGGKMGRELTLRRALAQLPEDYDVILIDCPPSLGLLTVNALVAAERALLTAEAQYFALQGVEQAMEVVELARDGLNPQLALLGVLLNRADMRTVHSREALAVVPAEPVPTPAARAALPAEVPFADAVFNVAHGALLTLGLARGDWDLLGRSLQDRLHQQRRHDLFPRSLELASRARELGALGATISGAGPAVLVWCFYEQTGAVAETLRAEIEGWATLLRTPFESQGAYVEEL